MGNKRVENGVEIVDITTWIELQEELFFESWDPHLSRHRSPFAFRGVQDERYPLETSLMRLGGQYAYVERHLLRNLKKYSPPTIRERDTLWHWLTLGQHHGLPTRVLDWSWSPLVALHFAVWRASEMKHAGAVWMVDIVNSRRWLPKVLEDARVAADTWVYDVETLSAVAPRLEVFDGLSQQPFAVFYEPPSFDDRVVNQFALLSALSDPTVAFDDWLRTSETRCRKLVIPAALKWEIRDKLDQSNINDRMLFPGLDGLCDWLKRTYGPGGGKPPATP